MSPKFFDAFDHRIHPNPGAAIFGYSYPIVCDL
jgi:hypothetical protein